MADKTIPDLDQITTITDVAAIVVDSGIETFRMTVADFALYIRDCGLLLPPGATSAFAGGVAPTGWLFCDGAPVSRTTYVRLFTAISTAYGTGDGTTTFNLPDLRGRVVAGKDDMGGTPANRLTNAVSGFVGTTVGASGGAETYTPLGTNGGSQSIAHVHAQAQHTHTLSAHTHQGAAHTHNFKHVHMFAICSGASWYAKSAADNTSTTLSNADTIFLDSPSFAPQLGGTNDSKLETSVTGTRYTTGVLDAPSGTGSSAVTAAASAVTTGVPNNDVTSLSAAVNVGAMSANATVNGSNFTFTGTAGHRVQPTLVMNYIIKT